MLDLLNRLAEHNARLLAELLRSLADQLDAAVPGPPVVAFPILFSDGEEFAVGSITVGDDAQPLTASVTFKDAKGYDTQPSGVPQWSSSDDSVASVEASADGLSATVTVGAPGAAVIEVSETDESGEEITAQGTVTVQPGDAEIGDVSFSEGGGGAVTPEPPAEEQGEPVSPSEEPSSEEETT